MGHEELADYVVVNTCSFIEAAREESVRTLVELAAANKKVVITGCLAQHFQDELLEEIPEAVALVGTGDYQHIVSVIERAEAGERVKLVSPEPTYIADETVSPLPHYHGRGRLHENCRGLRLSLCLLHHPSPAGQPALSFH